MKVFILYESTPYEGGSIYGVYTSKVKALVAMRHILATYYLTIDIEEAELDTEMELII